jgi:hypothetical protein
MLLKGDPRSLFMSTVLYSLRTQLNSVRHLSMYLQQSWVGAEEAWRELARSTALTKLVLKFGKEVREGLM